MTVLRQFLKGHSISRFGDVPWSRNPDVLLLDKENLSKVFVVEDPLHD